ncbi:MAG: HAD-IA family hydrolase [Desulfobacterales bacterium]
MKNKPICIKAVLFDFDGTLTQPGALDFGVIRAAIDCPKNRSILEFIETLATKQQQEDALAVLEHFEAEAASKSKPNPGAEELIRHLRATGVPIGIITRNSLQSVKQALNNFQHTDLEDFELVITRDDPVAPKPNPEGVLVAARRFDVDPVHLLVVGDFIYDIQAGNGAGAVTVLLRNPVGTPSPDCQSDYTISRLEELKRIIRLARPLPSGKLPNDLLAEFIEIFSFDDPSVLIHPGIGEDTAAVNIEKEEVLVLKSDPITFTTDSIGHYAVLINANDIATSGATPRWFLTTLLFPCNVTALEIRQVMHELKTACQQWGISLCGGHTEITDAVTRPVVTGMLIGTVSKANLLEKRNIKPGDRVLFTKSVAVEGTAIIAGEMGDRLSGLGLKDGEIDRCRAFRSKIGITDEAQIAGRSPGVSAMHDVTEGGLATALEELGISGRHKIRIDMDKIPIYPETEKICQMLDIKPLGLIGSGSLLICCRKKNFEKLMAGIIKAGIDVTCIGEVMEKGAGIEAVSRGKPAKWPKFEVDEIARLFSLEKARPYAVKL